jgi:hypothetical protein
LEYKIAEEVDQAIVELKLLPQLLDQDYLKKEYGLLNKPKLINLNCYKKTLIISRI